MKKTIFAAAVALLGAMLLNSCSGFLGVNLTDQKQIDENLRHKIEKHIDPQSTVYNLSIGATGDFTLTMNIATVTFLAPGATEPQKLTVELTGNQSPRESKVFKTKKFNPETRKMEEPQYTTETGIKLADIDFSLIASNITKAAEMIKGEGYAMDGIRSYDMTFDGKPANTMHEFSIESKAGTSMGTQHGRAAMVTEYYELKFTADAAGNVTAVE